MSGYVYILKSHQGNFYVGSTNNPERRLGQHLSGHAQTTRNRKIYELVFIQKYSTLLQARRTEIKLKRFKRKDFLQKIVNDGYIRIS